MFAVAQLALVVLFAGCLTLASPVEKKLVNILPEVVVKKLASSPCAMKTKMNHNVKVSMATFAEYNGQVNTLVPFSEMEFQLGDNPTGYQGFDEALTEMCPGEIRLVKYSMLDQDLGFQPPSIIFEVELLGMSGWGR